MNFPCTWVGTFPNVLSTRVTSFPNDPTAAAVAAAVATASVVFSVPPVPCRRREIDKVSPRHSCRFREVRGPRDHMQSHACRPRSQLRRWERCIADQPGLAGGVCAPSCSDHFVPAGCTATTCVSRKEQPDNLATEEARPGETSRDAPTTPRRTAEPGPEPKARPEPELESGPEAEPEPAVDKDESPSSGSGSSHGSCNGTVSYTHLTLPTIYSV